MIESPSIHNIIVKILLFIILGIKLLDKLNSLLLISSKKLFISFFKRILSLSFKIVMKKVPKNMDIIITIIKDI